MLLYHVFPIIIATIPSHSVESLSVNHKECVIKICHNKDCSKRGGGERLCQTFRDLIPAPSSDILVPVIESSGCLSKCGNGPNVCVINTKTNEEKFFYGISDPLSASAVLDVATSEEGMYPIELLVAADVISKVGNTRESTKKEQLLNSAISQLTKDSNPILSKSYAHGHALYLRSDVRLEKSPPDIHGAIQDAKMAVSIVPKEIKAWRVLASAHEADDDIEEAIRVVREWKSIDSSFGTKAMREIERLESKI